MRRVLFITIIGAVGFLGACGEPVRPPAASLPRFNLAGDCQMDAVTCSYIMAGIQWLKNHPHSMCNQAGASAEARYNASSESGMGFRPGEVPDREMGVEMYPTPGQTFSGYSPVNGIILVTQNFVNSPNASNDASTGGLIAHEEAGHMTGDDGLGHNTGFADFYQQTCQQRPGE